MSKQQTAYTVAHSSSTYGEATPYAVVSTASGMPRLPAHGSEAAAQQTADRLNEEAQRETARLMAAQWSKAKADRLQAEARRRDKGQEDVTA